MISIIIPVYNQSDKISNCLDSILKQTFKDFEIIIVDDGSSDNLEHALNNFFRDKILNIKYKIINQKNHGAPAARNRGFEESSGNYLFFCDADSILDPDALEIMFETLNDHPEASYAYPSHYWGRKLFRLWAFDPEKLKQMPYIHTMALIRREHFPGFDINIKKFQDWDLWLTMLREGHTGVWIDKPLFTIAPGGTMSDWLPSFAYKLFPFLPAVKKYKRAMAIIKEKHKIK